MTTPHRPVEPGQQPQPAWTAQHGWPQPAYYPPPHHPHYPYYLPPYFQHPPFPIPTSRPPEPKPPPHRWGFGAFLLAEVVFIVVSVLVPLGAMVPYLLVHPDAALDNVPLPAPVLVAALIIPQLIAAAVGLIATRLRGNGPVIDLRLRFGWRDVGIGVACGVAGVFLTIPLSLLWSYAVGADNANSAVGDAFKGLSMPVALAVVLFLDIWLIAPICEEIMFRGLLWGAMQRRGWNRWIILVATTTAFAAGHFELARMPLLLFIGLPIGVARLLSGRLAASVIAHQINNFLPALVLMLLLVGHPIGA